MALYFKGAAVGTHWHINDAGALGFVARDQNIQHDVTAVIEHVARASKFFPYISLTSSFAIARDYAILGASSSFPGYVYEIQVPEPLPIATALIDPIEIIVNHYVKQLSKPYHHDGDSRLLLGIVAPDRFSNILFQPTFGPTGLLNQPPNFGKELDTIVRTLRDSEMLLFKSMPKNWVRGRHDVF